MSFNELDLSILKTIISNKKHSVEFVNEYDDRLFSPEVWNAAKLIVGYVKTYKELPTLRVISDKLSKGGNDKLIEHVKKVWEALEAHNYNDKEYKYDLEKFKRRFAERQLSQMKDSLNKVDPVGADIGKTLNDINRTVQSIKSLSQKKTFERKTLKDAIPQFREEYNAKMENPTFDRGIQTRYSVLDNATDGLRPGELLLIGGESSSGKSMLLMNMAVQMWLQQNNIDMEEGFTPGENVLYFSLEMPFKPCLNRVLARLSSTPSKLIRNAKLNNDDALKLKKALKFINRYPSQFEIVDIPRGATMESLEMIYEDVKSVYDPKVVVIDYLGLMDYEGTGDMDDWLKLGKISEKMHEFSRVHNCTVLSAVQLNRAKSKEPEDRIGMHRVGRSALILQNANIAIQIETRPNEKNYPDMIYHLIKNRDGELVKGTLIKNLACGTLLDNSVEEDQTEFTMRDPDDISQKIELLDV
jgi:replicative DNA helicase